MSDLVRGHVVTIVRGSGAAGPEWEGLPCWVGPRMGDFLPDSLWLWPLAERPDADSRMLRRLPPAVLAMHPFTPIGFTVRSTGLGEYHSRLLALATHPLARPPRVVVATRPPGFGGYVVAAPHDGELGHHRHAFVPTEQAARALALFLAGHIDSEEMNRRTYGAPVGGQEEDPWAP